MWLEYLGIACEAVGLIVTFTGLDRARRDQGLDRAWWFQGIFQAVQQTGRRLGEKVRRRLGRPGPDAFAVGIGIESSAAVGSPTVTVTWPAMDPSLPQAEAVALLDDRLRELHRQTNALTIRQDHRVAAVEERSDATAKEVARLRNELAETRRHLQVEGLRVEAWGLALVGFGLLLQLIGRGIS